MSGQPKLLNISGVEPAAFVKSAHDESKRVCQYKTDLAKSK